MTKELYEGLVSCCGREAVAVSEEMKTHTSFRIGGNAAYFVTPDSEEALLRTAAYVREENVPYFIMGNGSNLLVSDRGYDGVIIQIGKKMSAIRQEGCTLQAEAGALLAKIAQRALEASLAGFAFASGIPGTLGGACMMNAGAYGGEMKDVLESVRVLRRDGAVREIGPDEMGLGYRTSAFEKNGDIVLSGVIRLAEGDRTEIGNRMEELAAQRREKQPLTLPSAGSTFKRPEGYFAGKLIMDAGLKGYQIGGARVSEKHAGFIVNAGGATAGDVRNLIAHVQKTVFEAYGVALETEVKFLGFDD